MYKKDISRLLELVVRLEVEATTSKEKKLINELKNEILQLTSTDYNDKGSFHRIVCKLIDCLLVSGKAIQGIIDLWTSDM